MLTDSKVILFFETWRGYIVCFFTPGKGDVETGEALGEADKKRKAGKAC